MSKKQFTDAALKRIKPKDDRYDIYEGGGLSLRVFPTGKKVFRYRYMIDGKSRTITIGSFPYITLAEARQQQRDIESARARGEDPAAERQAAKKHTFGALAEAYLERKASQFKDQGKETRRIFANNILPYLEKTQADKVSRADVSMVINKMLDRGLNRSANIVLQKITALYNWGLDAGMIEGVSPCYRMKKVKENAPRSRVLSDSEIKALFSKSSNAAMTMQLTLLTGQRNGETLLENKHIDGHWWTIPSGDYKTGIEQRVYLSPPALALIRKIKPLHNVTVLSQSARRWGVTWQPHDLRRTTATRIGDMDYPDEHIQRLLGHSVGKISRTYNRRKYDQQKRRMAVVWAWELRKILRKKESPST